MFFENHPCTFKTSKGSSYIIAKKVVYRESFRGETFDDPGRNIFYAEQDITRALLDKRVKHLIYQVSKDGGRDGVIIRFSDGSSYRLTIIPQIGLCPIDMFLDDNGKCTHDPMGVLRRCHIGHDITNIKYLTR